MATRRRAPTVKSRPPKRGAEGPPVKTELRLLCDELEAVEDSALDALLPSVLARIESWPAHLRVGEVRRVQSSELRDYWTRESAVKEHGPLGGWLWDLFDGRFNPRLAVLRRARLGCQNRFDPGTEDPWEGKWGKQSAASLLLAIGRHLEPSFAYSHELYVEYGQTIPGEARKTSKYGDATRGFSDCEYTLEHAADDSLGNDYALYGLQDAHVTLEIVGRSGAHTYDLWVSGAAPAVLELGLLWSELLAHGPALLDSAPIGEIVAKVRNVQAIAHRR